MMNMLHHTNVRTFPVQKKAQASPVLKGVLLKKGGQFQLSIS